MIKLLYNKPIFKIKKNNWLITISSEMKHNDRSGGSDHSSTGSAQICYYCSGSPFRALAHFF